MATTIGKITLRSNQEEPIRKAIDFFKEKRPVPSLIVLPTAWGKSIMTAFVAASSEDPILVVQPSKELLEQNYGKYMTLCEGFGSRAGIYSASFHKKEVAHITYATIGSIKNLGEEFRAMGFKKMLIDEAHLYPREADSMLGRFLADSGITHVLGITATPIKLQQNFDIEGNTFSKLVMLTTRSKKGNFFKRIIHVGQIGEMVKLGFWSPLKYEVASFDSTGLIYNSQKSEFTEESVQRAYEKGGGLNMVIKALDDHRDRKHILVFVPSIDEALTLAESYPSTEALYSGMPMKERKDIIERFKRGETRVLANVQIVSTGFDYIGIDCIVMARSTASIALYYQIIGRATRIDPCKKDALIIDLGGNYDRFGRVEDIVYEQDATLKWRMYGSGGKLLSDMPIHEIGFIMKEDVEKDAAEKIAPIEDMPFGKYKGQKIADIPMGYRKWMLENFDWTGKGKLKKSIVASLGI